VYTGNRIAGSNPAPSASLFRALLTSISMEEASMAKTVLILVARLIFAAAFAMAAVFKFLGMEGTAGYIASAGFPIPMILAWCAALFETALVIAFLTGVYFSEAALLAAAYVVFLGFAFHGPSHWEGNQMEFGSFINHFIFMAGLFYAAVHGPGKKWAAQTGVLWK
jgi:putative oxidoreductase